MQENNHLADLDQNHPLVKTINTRFGGVIRQGGHSPNGKACAMEAVTAALSKDGVWSDQPNIHFPNRVLPSFIGINDRSWSRNNATRTKAIVPVLVALWDAHKWSNARWERFANSVVEALTPIYEKDNNMGIISAPRRWVIPSWYGTKPSVGTTRTRDAEVFICTPISAMVTTASVKKSLALVAELAYASAPKKKGN